MGNDTVRQAINQFTVFELDDFTCDEASLYALTKLKQRYPGFKATLFTVLGKCDLHKLMDVMHLGWLEIAVHGQDHATERFWDYDTTRYFLLYAEELKCTKLFKVPWDDMPTDDFLSALVARDWHFATRNRLYASSVHLGAGITTYLGCPQSMWLHPFQLDARIDVPMTEPFLTVSEVMQLPQAKEMGWILA